MQQNKKEVPNLTTESVLRLSDIPENMNIKNPSSLQIMVSKMLNTRTYKNSLDVATYRGVMENTLDKILDNRLFDGVIQTLANKRADIYEALPEAKVSEVIEDLYASLPKYLVLPAGSVSNVSLGEAVILVGNLERKSFGEYSVFLDGVKASLAKLVTTIDDLNRTGPLSVDGRLDNLVKESIVNLAHGLDDAISELEKKLPEALSKSVRVVNTDENFILPNNFIHEDYSPQTLTGVVDFHHMPLAVQACSLTPAWAPDSEVDMNLEEFNFSDFADRKRDLVNSIKELLSKHPKLNPDDDRYVHETMIRTNLRTTLNLLNTSSKAMKDLTFSKSLEMEVRKVAKAIVKVI